MFCARAVFVLIAHLALPAAASPQLASVAAARQVIAKLRDIVRQPQAPRLSQLTPLLDRHFDFARFEEHVLKDAAPHFSTEQRQEFARQFRDLLAKRATLSLALPRFRNACQSHTLEEGPRKDDSTKVLIHCRTPRSVVKIALFLTHRRAGYRLYDVQIRTTLLSRQYRAMINRLLRREGMPGLFAAIKRETRKLDEQLLAERGRYQSSALPLR